MKRKQIFRSLRITVVIAALFFPLDAFAEYGDILLNRTLDSMTKAEIKSVIFPHWFHRIRFKCKVCHEEIFILKRGANKMNMTNIMMGEYCGKCHNGLVAWETLYCDRCHSYVEEEKEENK